MEHWTSTKAPVGLLSRKQGFSKSSKRKLGMSAELYKSRLAQSYLLTMSKVTMSHWFLLICMVRSD